MEVEATSGGKLDPCSVGVGGEFCLLSHPSAWLNTLMLRQLVISLACVIDLACLCLYVGTDCALWCPATILPRTGKRSAVRLVIAGMYPSTCNDSHEAQPKVSRLTRQSQPLDLSCDDNIAPWTSLSLSPSCSTNLQPAPNLWQCLQYVLQCLNSQKGLIGGKYAGGT